MNLSIAAGKIDQQSAHGELATSAARHLSSAHLRETPSTVGHVSSQSQIEAPSQLTAANRGADAN